MDRLGLLGDEARGRAVAAAAQPEARRRPARRVPRHACPMCRSGTRSSSATSPGSMTRSSTILRAHGAAQVHVSSDSMPRELTPTADFVYVRFHDTATYHGEYVEPALEPWAGFLREQARAGPRLLCLLQQRRPGSRARRRAAADRDARRRRVPARQRLAARVTRAVRGTPLQVAGHLPDGVRRERRLPTRRPVDAGTRTSRSDHGATEGGAGPGPAPRPRPLVRRGGPHDRGDLGRRESRTAVAGGPEHRDAGGRADSQGRRPVPRLHGDSTPVPAHRARAIETPATTCGCRGCPFTGTRTA